MSETDITSTGKVQAIKKCDIPFKVIKSKYYPEFKAETDLSHGKHF